MDHKKSVPKSSELKSNKIKKEIPKTLTKNDS